MKKKKKHIDTFLLSKEKKYKYYYKKNIFFTKTSNKFNTNFNKNLNFYYGLQLCKSGFLTLKSIKAVLKLIKWFLRKFNLRFIRYKINFFPDFVITERSKDTRMGKGKAAPKEKVAYVKKNQILIEFSKPKTDYERSSLKKLIKNCKIKLNLPTFVKKNIW